MTGWVPLGVTDPVVPSVVTVPVVPSVVTVPVVPSVDTVGGVVPSVDGQKADGLVPYCLKRDSSFSERELFVLHSAKGLQGPPNPTIYRSPAERTLPGEPQVVTTSGPETPVKIFPTCMSQQLYKQMKNKSILPIRCHTELC